MGVTKSGRGRGEAEIWQLRLRKMKGFKQLFLLV